MEYIVHTDPSPIPRLAGRQTYEKGWKKLSCPRGNVIFFMLEGCFSFTLNDRVITAEKNDFIIFKKNTEYKVCAEEDCNYFYLHFYGEAEYANGDALNTTERDLVLPEKVSFTESSEKRERVIKLFGLCERIIREKPIYEKLRLNNILEEILISAATIHAEKKTEQIPPSIKRIAKYISTNISLSLSLEQIANRYMLSKQYIMRSFKRYYGMSVTHFINKTKLEYSLILLRDSDMTVDEISNSLSYSSSSYFCRLFKKYFDITPTEYRHQIIELY